MPALQMLRVLNSGLPPGASHRGVALSALYLKEALQFLYALTRLLEGLVQLLVYEDVVLIAVFQVLTLFLQVLKVYPRLLDLLI
jgi:hypothetical protein